VNFTKTLVSLGRGRVYRVRTRDLFESVLRPAGAYVGQWMQSFREFPPRMKPGSFSLDRVMEAVTAPPTGSN
jgi:hypothetical protein